MILRFLRKREFLSNLSLYISGALISQIVNLGSSIVLARLYTARDFGLFGVILAITSVISPIMSGRYQDAIVIQKRKVDALNLLYISLAIAILVSFLIFIIVYIRGEWILNVTGMELPSNDILFVPLILISFAFFSIYSYYINWLKRYKVLAKSKILQASSSAIASIIVAVFGFTKYGLIFGYVIGFLLGTIYLIKNIGGLLPSKIFSKNKKKLYLLYKYREFPVYNGLAGIISGIQAAIPVMFITSWYTFNEVGYYTLMYKSICVPFAIISVAFSQINFKHVSDLINNKKDPRGYIIKSHGFLFSLFFLPAGTIYFFGESIFSIVFGTQWLTAGTYAETLVIGLSFSFISSALSTTLSATMRLKKNLIWQLFATISTLAVFIYYSPKGSINNLLYAQNINYIVVYSIYSFIIYKSVYSTSLISSN